MLGKVPWAMGFGLPQILGGRKKAKTILSEAYQHAGCLECLPVDTHKGKASWSTFMTSAAFLEGQCRQVCLREG